MRLAHYLKQLNSNQIPSDCIWVDTETDAVRIDERSEKHVLREGMACHRRQYAREKWTKEDWCEFTDRETFWEYVQSKLHGKIKLYVFAHSWSFDAPVLHLFDEMTKMGWTLQSAIIESPPIILKYRKDKQTIIFIDTLNIWRMPLKMLGDSLDLPKLDMPDLTACKSDWVKYNKRDVEIIMLACLNWFKFIRDNNLGGFAPTTASQAMRTFRHRFMVDQILIDDDIEALTLARTALFGGRTEAFQLGKIVGDVYKLDYNSMYPEVMTGNSYPTVLCGYTDSVSIKKLAEHVQSFCVIAKVDIETDENCFPLIHNKRLVFPVGSYTTTLTTPELIYALENNYIKKVYDTALYFRAPIFSGYMTFFHRLKQQAEKEGNMVLRAQVKLLLNSLWGKFAQRGRFYEKYCDDPDNKVQVWQEHDVDENITYSFRSYGGITELLRDDGESRESHPAIAAHVTAFARLKLHKAITQAGYDNTYYCDTDSIWTNKTGFTNLANEIKKGVMGKLAIEGVSDHVTIHGLKDYVFGDETRIKGIKKKARRIATDIYEQEQFSSLKYNIRNGDLNSPIVTTLTKTLKRDYVKAVETPSGRLIPLRFIDNLLS